MMIRFFFAFLLLALPAPAARAAAPHCGQPEVNDTDYSISCYLQHQSGDVNLVFRGVVFDDPGEAGKKVELQSIDLLRDGALVQTLNLFAGDDPQAPQTVYRLSQLTAGFFEEEQADLDFDSFDDLKLLRTQDGRFAYWLYDPADLEFQRQKNLDNRLAGERVQIDPAARLIRVWVRNSDSDTDIFTYRWVGNRLVAKQRLTLSAYDRVPPQFEDIPGIKNFVRRTHLLCAAMTLHFNDDEKVVEEIDEPVNRGNCAETGDYQAGGDADQRLNGTRRHDGMVDVYKNGLLQSRSIVNDPPADAHLRN